MTSTETNEYDVVVVGHGMAGLATAIEAAEAGARVALLEKGLRGERGGSTRFTGGAFLLPMPNPKAVAARFDLSEPPTAFTRGDFVNALVQASDGRADRDLVDAMADEALEGIAWLADRGVDWELPIGGEFTGYGRYDGALRVDGAGDTRGAALVDVLTEHARDLGVKPRYRTAVRDIDIDDGVVRVFAADDDGPVCYEAPATVLCAGSFTASAEKRARYIGDGDLYKVRGTRYNTGEVLERALKAGAASAGRWSGAHAVMIDARAPDVEGGQTKINGFQYGVLLNRHGERFIDEGQHFASKSYARFGPAIHDQPGSRAYLLFDESVADRVVNFHDADAVDAETLSELFAELDLDTDRAQQTVDAFNENTMETPFRPNELDGKATRGVEPPKSNWAVPLTEPPFRCYQVNAGITFTYGGLATDTNARVLDTRGEPIEGLWAAGNIVGGLFYESYPSGAALTASLVFGRRAGRAAAERAARLRS